MSINQGEDLAQLFTSLQKITLQSQAQAQYFSPFTFQNQSPQYEDNDQMNDSLNTTQTNLSAIPSINFDIKLVEDLNQIWNGSYCGRSLKSMFNRHYHAQRRSFKQLIKQSKIQKYVKPKKQVNWQMIKLQHGKMSVVIQFNSSDLQTVRKGQICPSIIHNYIKILQLCKVISASYYIFPFDFFDKILTGKQNDSQQIKANVIKNYKDGKELIKGNISQVQYLLIPIFIQQGYKLIIVRNLTLRMKKNLILCNIKKEDCYRQTQALRLFLQIDLNNKNKKSKKRNFKESCLPTASFMLPRELNPKDTGLYFMLYCQFLFAKQGQEFQQIASLSSWKKMHLFPKTLALLSRVQIWNLFVKLVQEQNEEKRGDYCVQFLKKRMQVCEETILQMNYDKIQERQKQKYCLLTKGANADKLGINYYLDSIINYQNSIQE